VNGTKFFGTYLGDSKSSNHPNAVYCAGVGSAFHACHIEGFPIPMVTFAGDALTGLLPNTFWGGGANFLAPEVDLDSDGVGIAAPFIFSGQDGAGVAGGAQAASAYVWLMKVLGAATKVAWAVKNAADTITASCTGEGIIRGTWLRNGGITAGVQGTGSLPVVTQVDATTTTFGNVLQVPLTTGRTYDFEAVMHVTATAGGGSKFRLNATGGLTASVIRYDSLLLDMTTSAYTNTTRSTAFDAVATQAGSTACLWIIKGSLTTTGSGSLNLQFAQQAASGTSSVLVGSTFHVRQVG